MLNSGDIISRGNFYRIGSGEFHYSWKYLYRWSVFQCNNLLSLLAACHIKEHFLCLPEVRAWVIKNSLDPFMPIPLLLLHKKYQNEANASRQANKERWWALPEQHQTGGNGEFGEVGEWVRERLCNFSQLFKGPMQKALKLKSGN